MDSEKLQKLKEKFVHRHCKKQSENTGMTQVGCCEGCGADHSYLEAIFDNVMDQDVIQFLLSEIEQLETAVGSNTSAVSASGTDEDRKYFESIYPYSSDLEYVVFDELKLKYVPVDEEHAQYQNVIEMTGRMNRMWEVFKQGRHLQNDIKEW